MDEQRINEVIEKIFNGEEVTLSEEEIFRKLDAEEEEEFREHTRKTYVPHSPINPVWHPVVRDECHKINGEANQ